MTGFSIIALMGFGALAVDVNRAHDQRVKNQMIADSAALSAAIAYVQGGRNTAILQPTAQDVVIANGLASSTATATVAADFPASGNTAVKVVVSTNVPFTLASILSSGTGFTVNATAYASLPGNTSSTYNPCFLALSTGSTALSTSGGATISMAGCDAMAIGGIYNGGTGMTVNNLVSGSGSVGNNYGYISANLVNYSTSWSNPAWNTAIPAANKIVQQNTTLADGLASNTDLASARALLGSYTAPNTMSNPTTTGNTNWTFNYSPNAAVSGFQTSSGNFTVPAGTYNIKTLTVAGGVSVTFAAGSNITVSAGVVNGGAALNFGNSNLSVNGGFNSGSSGVTIGNGNVSIGSGTISFAGTNTIGNGTVTMNDAVSLSGGSSLTIGAGNHSFKSLAISGGSFIKLGAGDLDVAGGISVGGSSTLAAGAGAYRLGPSTTSPNNCMTLAGSAVVIIGDGTFSCNAGISTAGGSRLVFGATTNHFINGNMTIAGSALFGAGRYTVNGNFTNGTGGTLWPYTSPVTGATYGSTLAGVSVSGYDMAGVNVSFILAGTLNLAGGAKSKLIAASTTATGGAIGDILLHSLTTTATSWGAGAQSMFAGMVHLPNSNVTMSGGTTTLASGQCFMLTANTITLSGGASTGSACSSITSASTTTTSTNITLVG